MTDARQIALQQWLQTSCQLQADIMQPLAGDASFRRYFRIQEPDVSYIAMDAPPERENCLPFVAISQGLQTLGLITPHVFAQDLTRGFLLLSDFGDRLLLHELNPHNAKHLYTSALQELSVLQSCPAISGWTIPTFTAEFMRQELDWFKEWFLLTHLKMTFTQPNEQALAHCFDFLAESAARQPLVFMHRDFHSANLMVLPDDKIGILDFQDAFYGPVTYDLVSLLRDCYISWPDTLVTELVLAYRAKLPFAVNEKEFLRWFDLMGLQRHLKALLTFARKYHRDHNPNYLPHIPRTLEYIVRVSERYPECKVLATLMKEVSTCAP